jgi:gas vesicle protein
MNSTSDPKAPEPHDNSIARADERLAHAHEQLLRADEQLTRLSEQVARMEREAARAPSTEPGPQSPPGTPAPARQALVGLPLAACIIAAALVVLSSYGGGAKLFVANWTPQFASTQPLPPENPLPAELAPAAVQVAAAGAAPPLAAVAQTAPQDTAPTATAGLPDNTQLLQTMARNLANLERSIEQLKTAQQQMANDSSKEIAELRASQEEIKRVLVKVSEQNLSKASPPATQPTPTVRKPERTVQSPRARARPRIPREREWIYDDYW